MIGANRAKILITSCTTLWPKVGALIAARANRLAGTAYFGRGVGADNHGDCCYSPRMIQGTGLSRVAACAVLAGTFFLGDALHAATSLPLETAESSFKFTGKSFLHSFQGQAQDITGSASVSAGAKPFVQSAKLVFKTTALTTFNKDRDGKMKEWLHVDAHPDIVFQLQKVTPVSGDYKVATAADPAKFTVTGVLSINGVEQAISEETTGWRDKNHLVVTGQTVIDTLKFGLPQIRLAVITVATDVKAEYKFSFSLPPELSLK